MTNAEELCYFLLTGSVDRRANVDGEGIEGDDTRYYYLVAERPVLWVAWIIRTVPIYETGLMLLELCAEGIINGGEWQVIG